LDATIWFLYLPDRDKGLNVGSKRKERKKSECQNKEKIKGIVAK
jgi:hypothetical protein